MISWFKKYFITKKENNNIPYPILDSSINFIILGVIFIEIFTFLIPTFTHINQTGEMASVVPVILDELTNKERAANNKDILTTSTILNKAAQMKATDMANNRYFAHTSPDGKNPWYWLDQVGYKYQYAGENLAINFTDSKDITNAWMESPSHKSNIIKETYTEMGTGIAIGMYEGQKTIFVAQLYANPLPIITETVITGNITGVAPTIISELSPTKANTNVLGAETINETQTIKSSNISKPTLVQKMFASPRNTTNSIIFTILGILIVTLFLNFLIKIKHINLYLVTKLLFILAIMGGIFVINNYFSYKDVVVTKGLNYSNQNK